MPDIFRLSTDQTILGADGAAVANGQVHFYDRKKGEYAPVYGDAGLAVALRQPVQADSTGILPAIYLDDAIAYRAVITDRDNNRIREIDDVRRHREGIKVLDGIEALKRYCGNDPFVLVAAEGGCPVFYKRLSGCDLPDEKLPDVVRADCCDCPTAWHICKSEPDICAMETAQLDCSYHVLVQECRRRGSGPDDSGTTQGSDSAYGSDDSYGPDSSYGSAGGCGCKDGSAAAVPTVKKASIGALFSAAARCLPQVCIPNNAFELALDPNGGLVYGNRVPPPITDSGTAAFAACLHINIGTHADQVARHLRLDSLPGVRIPQIRLENLTRCTRRYEIRALNRLNRAREEVAGDPRGAPAVAANMQTRMGMLNDPRLDSAYGIADSGNSALWLQDLSIADSTMGEFLSGVATASSPMVTNPIPAYTGANGYTENTLIVDLAGGASAIFTLKFHIYWDMNPLAQLAIRERIHFGTRIIARQVR